MLSRPVRSTIGIFALTATLALTGCQSSPSQGTDKAAAPAVAPLVLPDSAKPNEKLLPLSFMAGRWVGVAPRAALVNEEHWMAPRGNAMVGTFRQVRRDGKSAFVEVSQIAVENGEVLLRVRHMHGQLEVPEKRKDVSIFKLKSAAGNRAEFTGTGDAEGVTSVVYTLVNDDELTQTIGFDPKSKEQGFTSVYRREGK